MSNFTGARAATSEMEGGILLTRWRTQDLVCSGILGFKRWLAMASDEGQAAVRPNGTISLAPSLSERFCTGMVDYRHFVGVPHHEAFWVNLPIAGIGVDPQAGALVLCVQSIQAEAGGGETLSDVALVLAVEPAVYCARIAMHPYIDIRTIVQMEGDTSVGRMAVDAVPTFITDIDRPASEIVADALNATFSNPSSSSSLVV